MPTFCLIQFFSTEYWMLTSWSNRYTHLTRIYEVHSKSIWLFLFHQNQWSTGKILWCHFLYICENFHAGWLCQLSAVMPRVLTCSAHLLDFHFHTRCHGRLWAISWIVTQQSGNKHQDQCFSILIEDLYMLRVSVKFACSLCLHNPSFPGPHFWQAL